MARESGFEIRIKGFVPMPKNDFKLQAEIANALHEATKGGGNLADVVAKLQGVEVEAKATSRNAPETSAEDEDSGSGSVQDSEEGISRRRAKAA